MTGRVELLYGRVVGCLRLDCLVLLALVDLVGSSVYEAVIVNREVVIRVGKVSRLLSKLLLGLELSPYYINNTVRNLLCADVAGELTGIGKNYDTLIRLFRHNEYSAVDINSNRVGNEIRRVKQGA